MLRWWFECPALLVPQPGARVVWRAYPMRGRLTFEARHAGFGPTNRRSISGMLGVVWGGER